MPRHLSSLWWRLTALILVLTASLGAIFAWTAYRQMHRALILRGTASLQDSAREVGELLAQAAAARVEEARRLADQPAIRVFAAGCERSQEAYEALKAFADKSPNARITLTSRAGLKTVRSEHGTAVLECGVGQPSSPTATSVGPLTVRDGHTFFTVHAAVPSGEGAGVPAGVVTLERRLSSSPSGVAVITRLLGNDAQIKLGNATGDVWTDLANPVAAPPIPFTEGAASSFMDASGVERLGTALSISGTPWQVWVDFSAAGFREPARTLLWTMLPPTLLMILLGGVAVGAVSGTITRPLERAADAADAIARGDYSSRLQPGRNDEIGRLTTAFNVMAERVANSYTALEQRVQERTRDLELAQQQLDQFFEMSPDLLCIADMEGRFVRINPAWHQVLGWSTSELTAKPYTDFVHPEDRHATDAQSAALASGAPVISFENRFLCNDGTVRWLNWKAAPQPERGLIYATARDVTDALRVERELHHYAAHLAATNRELEAFSYSVSHDLRAPLRSIDGFSQALLEDCADSLGADGQEYLGRIRRAAQRMGQLIDDLLKLARVTRADMQPKVVDLSALAAKVLENLRAAEPGRAVECRIEPGICAVGDGNLLQIAMTNLLENAWKFTGKRDLARIEFGVERNGHGTAYFVRDNGAGFDMTYADKLFGTFQRLHHADDFPGTGIGLATVQRIINRHGGRIWAEARPNECATFSFTLTPEPAWTHQ